MPVPVPDPAPAPSRSWQPPAFVDPDAILGGLGVAAGGSLVLLGATVVVVTILEDVATLGLGVLDDVPTIVLGAGMVAGGVGMIRYSVDRWRCG